MIEELPQELLEEVFEYCSIDDLINVACCNKLYYSLVKPLLWRAVKIPLSECQSSTHMFQNLRHTVSLNLHDDDDWEELDDGNSAKNIFDSGINLARILNNCNPLKVDSLSIYNIAEEGVYYTIEVLHQVKSLELNQSNINNWSKINQLPKLKELVLNECQIDEDAIEDILLVCKLEELCLAHCSNLTSNVVLHISKATNLTKLSLDSIAPNNTLEIKHLGNLVNLVYLKIRLNSFTDESLIHLCLTLNKLKELDLSSSHFSDNGLREINMLTSLSKLVIRGCPLTSNCFNYISSLACLHSIAFSGAICFGGKKVSCLNKIRTLKKIDVSSNPESIGRIIQVLCAEKPWKLRFEQRYIFSC